MFLEIAISIFAIFVFILFPGFVIVEERHQVVLEYWGSYSKILSTGLHFYNKFTTSPKTITWGTKSLYQIPLNEQIFDPPNLTISTVDLCEVGVDIVIHYRIDDVIKAVYNTPNLLNLIEQTVNTSLREICSTMSVHKINADRGNIVKLFISSCDQILSNYGVYVTRAQIQNIKLPSAIVEAQSKAIATQTTEYGELQATKSRLERNAMETESVINLRLSEEHAEISRRKLIIDSVASTSEDEKKALALKLMILDKWTSIASRCKLVCVGNKEISSSINLNDSLDKLL